MDESTDVAGFAVLLVFVRYALDKTIEEDLLLCECLQVNTSGKEMFNTIDSYLKMHGILWDKGVDVCSDGAMAMVGKLSGAVARIKNVAPTCTAATVPFIEKCW